MRIRFLFIKCVFNTNNRLQVFTHRNKKIVIESVFNKTKEHNTAPSSPTQPKFFIGDNRVICISFVLMANCFNCHIVCHDL